MTSSNRRSFLIGALGAGSAAAATSPETATASHEFEERRCARSKLFAVQGLMIRKKIAARVAEAQPHVLRAAPSLRGRIIAFVCCALGLTFASASFAAAAPASPVVSSVPADNPRQSRLDRAVDQAAASFFQNRCHVGLSVAVVEGGHAAFYDYDSVSRGSARLPTSRSIYEIASVTKTFTGALAARAVLDGRMTLDGDFRAYLPGQYPNLSWADGQPINLRELATHRSGLQRDLPDTDAFFGQPDPTAHPYQLIDLDRGYARARYLRELKDVRLRSQPGGAEVYSNLGFKIIGFGLETVYKEPFETLMQNDLLGPLHMADTGFAVPASSRARLVQGYSRAGTLMPYHLRNAGAAWGLYSTPEDMAKYVSWQLDETDPLIRLAHQPVYGTAQDGQALVWNLASDEGRRMLFHGGGSFGMTSQVVLYPDIGQGYVMLANDSCQGTESALKSIATDVHRILSAEAAPSP